MLLILYLQHRRNESSFLTPSGYMQRLYRPRILLNLDIAIHLCRYNSAHRLIEVLECALTPVVSSRRKTITGDPSDFSRSDVHLTVF